MPVLYKPFQSVLEDKNKKKLFHPRVIYTAQCVNRPTRQRDSRLLVSIHG